ncbi:MAG: 30S ribosomal protein S16 [Helicobacteraceae bacterium]|jgi:small subunit ribosomal protein S16|nr:30S ribosomal protein S16 [Helicobacteraceae bacterium]MDR2033500.1 30S ribosomal protein S16 [Helicobacteraceae bacterium]
MTVIRLTRLGKKKQPFYRIVVTDSRKRRDSGFTEILGFYNPMNEEKTLKLDRDRYAYWVKVGAKPSETVARIAAKA